MGTGGGAGISFDGTLSEYLKIPTSAVSEIPCTLDMSTAGAQVLPYVTAYYNLVKRANIQTNETVLVAGALGQVGQAAMSICRWKDCHSIALVRGSDSVIKAEAMGWTAYNTESTKFMEKLIDDHGGADMIFNPIGNIIRGQYLFSLKGFERIVTIDAQEGMRDVNVNLHALYRSNQEVIGVNSVSLDYSQNENLLNELKCGFESGALLTEYVNENETRSSINL